LRANPAGPRYTRSVAAGLTGVVSIDQLANRKPVRECLQFFTREKSWISEKHLQLCRVPAPTFLEQKRAEWMAAEFRELGWEAQLDAAGNVVAALAPRGGKPLIAVTAHLDTVLAPRNREEIRVEGDGRFSGPGVADNGAGLAALLALARALRIAPVLEESQAEVVLVANVGEEGEGNLSGMRYLARQSPLAARIGTYLVLDGPSVERITARAVASRRFELAYSGAGGHSWSDYGNANPVHALGHAIAWFTAQFPAGNGSGPRCSFNFGTIEGGLSVNSIPVSARAKLDLRSEAASKIDELAATLATALDQGLEIENRRATGAKVQGRMKEIGSRPGGQLAENAPLLGYLRAVDGWLGIRARLDSASTDANIPLSLGLQAVSLGAGGQGGGAHTAAEWYSPEGRDLGLKRILLTLLLLVRHAQGPCPAARCAPTWRWPRTRSFGALRSSP
jgi:tripeptide aminopeptidase